LNNNKCDIHLRRKQCRNPGVYKVTVVGVAILRLTTCHRHGSYVEKRFTTWVKFKLNPCQVTKERMQLE